MKTIEKILEETINRESSIPKDKTENIREKVNNTSANSHYSEVIHNQEIYSVNDLMRFINDQPSEIGRHLLQKNMFNFLKTLNDEQ